MKTHLPDLKKLPYGGASAIIDSEIDYIINQAIVSAANSGCLNDVQIQNTFVETYFYWLQQSRYNNLKNLNQFKILSFSNGTTEGFDNFYINNSNCRFRILRGEYMYHVATWKDRFRWAYMDQDDLRTGDAVIISMPFSDTGNQHPQTNQILDICESLQIPVLIDCAFIGICSDIEFDFAHPAITDITFSLSKTLPVANLRIGMRCRRQDNDDGLLILHKTNYTNRLAAAVGLDLIKKFDQDYNYRRWKSTQQEFCSKLGVEPSSSVIFGIGNSNWQSYNRGGSTNRLCFSKYFIQGLPCD